MTEQLLFLYIEYCISLLGLPSQNNRQGVNNILLSITLLACEMSAIVR